MSATESHSPTDLVEAGRLLHREGRLEEAERLYAQALAADEYCADAHQLMAVIAGQRGRLDEAIRGFRRAIAIEGPTHDRLYNLAEAYRASGEFQAALEAYNQVLNLDAGDLDAYRNCSAMVRDAAERVLAGGDSGEAERLRKLAAHYLVGLGHACLRAHQVASAEQAYREAVALDPAKAEAHFTLGAIALREHRPMEAEAHYRRAVELEPRSPRYLNNLGVALRSQLRIEEAANLFRRAIETDPSFDEARHNLEEYALPWLHFRADPPPLEVLTRHRQWGHAAVSRALQEVGAQPAFANTRDPHRPLKVAYVGLNTASRLMQGFFEPLLANHEANAVVTVLYITSGRLDASMKRFRELAALWHDASLGRAKDLTKRIREDGIDIMVDLAGHSDANRLDVFAYKPAPITVAWLGYPGTTGLPTMDYRITDHATDPPGAEALYTERLYRIEGGCFVYRPPEKAPPVAPTAARASGAVTFGNFDDPWKVSPETMRAWVSILRQLPEARLLLMAPEFADAGFAARIQSDFSTAGIDSERVELRRAPAERDAHLAAYAEVDIALDTFPYNGGLTTICEALWMGVPVVTLSGDRPSARTSASILAQIGLERLDSETAEEYVDTAVELAQDLPRLRTLREGMRERVRVSSLRDERGFARRFEAALREMWRRWCESGP